MRCRIIAIANVINCIFARHADGADSAGDGEHEEGVFSQFVCFVEPFCADNFSWNQFAARAGKETPRIEEGKFLATLEALENRCKEVVHSLACAISVLYHVGVDDGFWCGAL